MTAYELSELKMEVNEQIGWLNDTVRDTDGALITLTDYSINSRILSVFSKCLGAIDDALKAKG